MSRSIKKGPYINVSLEKKILAMNESGKKSDMGQSFDDFPGFRGTHRCSS